MNQLQIIITIPLIFPADNNNSISFKFKEKNKGETGNNGTKDVNLMVTLKNLSNFWKIMPFINCEISFW